MGWCCLFAVGTVLFDCFPLIFSCITYLTSYHWTNVVFFGALPAPVVSPSAGNTFMVHYEGGVEVELRYFLGGVGIFTK